MAQPQAQGCRCQHVLDVTLRTDQQISWLIRSVCFGGEIGGEVGESVEPEDGV